MPKSPTARTLEECRRRGWLAEKTEYWNQWASIRVDLFGFVDVLAILDDCFLGIQATTTDNQAARIRKIQDEHGDTLARWKQTPNRVAVWGWMKSAKDRRWRVTETEL